MRPQRCSNTKSWLILIIISVWVASTLIAIPSLLFSKTLKRYSDRGYRTICRLVWPDGLAGHFYYDYFYNCFFLVVTYILPMSSMAVIYTWVGCTLWGSKVIGENTELQNGAVQSKRRLVLMLIAIMVLFGVCWLPYHIYFLYIYYHQEAIVSEYIQHIYLSVYWLAMSNSCFKLIVYYWMNKTFRHYFKLVLCLPRKALQNMGLLKERPRTPKMATFTCTAAEKSCRILLPHSRVENAPFSTRFTCSRL